MKAMELIRFALQMTDGGIREMVKDLHGDPLVLPTAGGKSGDGNHPLWLMGHLAYIEGSLRYTLLGEPNPVEDWAPLFASGSRPVADPAVYPPLETVIARYAELRAETLRLLESIGEAGLDEVPRHIPPGFENEFRTVGHTLLVVALHQMVHYGQMADARRVVGLKPLL